MRYTQGYHSPRSATKQAVNQATEPCKSRVQRRFGEQKDRREKGCQLDLSPVIGVSSPVVIEEKPVVLRSKDAQKPKKKCKFRMTKEEKEQRSIGKKESKEAKEKVALKKKQAMANKKKAAAEAQINKAYNDPQTQAEAAEMRLDRTARRKKINWLRRNLKRARKAKSPDVEKLQKELHQLENKDIIIQYLDAGYHDKANKVEQCANAVISYVCVEEACGTRYIKNVFYCHDRFCRVCNGIRAKKFAGQLISAIQRCEGEDAVKGTKSHYILLTPTFPNVEFSQLSQALIDLQIALTRLLQQFRRDGIVTGYARSIEWTIGDDGLCNLHPHIILQVPDDYYNKSSPIWRKYGKREHIDHDNVDLIDLWDRCLDGLSIQPLEGVKPSVKAQGIKGIEGALEVAKYLNKSSDIVALSLEDFIYVIEAFKGVRLYAAGDRLKIKEDRIEKFLELEDTIEKTQRQPGKCGKCGADLVHDVWKLNRQTDVYDSTRRPLTAHEISVDAHVLRKRRAQIDYFRDLQEAKGNETVRAGVEDEIKQLAEFWKRYAV